MKKILLINFGGIGDEILFLPVVKAVKNYYKEASVTLCLESRSRAFLSLTNLIDEYFFADIKTKNKYLEMLKLYFKALTGGFDIVLSSGSNPLIPVFLFFTGIKTRIGYSINGLSKILLTHPVKLNKNQYAALMYYDLAKSIINTEFEPPAIEMENCIKEKNSIVIHPGASRISIQKNIIKSPEAEFWADIIIKLLKNGRKVYLAGGSDDTECIVRIRDILKNKLTDQEKNGFVDMYGKTAGIKDLALLIKRSGLLLCTDSAPMHIGAALKTKTAAFFGPTDEKLLMPDTAECYALTNNAPCRPCLWSKRQHSCSEKRCLKFDADEIVRKIDKILTND